MPRLYLSPQELFSYPVGLALAGPLAQLQAIQGALDQALMRASKRCDNYCNKRLQAPLSTTIPSGNPTIAAGSTSIPVTSTLGWDNEGEQAVILNIGGATQEILPLAAGPVVVNQPVVAPYPGTLNLAAPTMYAHYANEPVAGCYQETMVVGSSNSMDVWADSLITQQAEIAQAHAPWIGQSGNLTRTVFLKQYPIAQIYKAEHAYSFNNTYVTLDVPSLIIEAMSGFYRVPLGTVLTPQGTTRTTYTAGFQNVPDVVKNATAYYLAAELQTFANPMGALNQRTGNRSLQFSNGTSRNWWVQQAEEALDDAELVRKT